MVVSLRRESEQGSAVELDVMARLLAQIRKARAKP
jgi:hypothetical protein